MFCSNCGKPIADGSKFCNHCGAPQNVISTGESAAQNPYTNAGTVATQAPAANMADPMQQYLNGPLQSATGFNVPQRPPEGMALLFVTCSGTSSRPMVNILDNGKVKPERYAKPGVNRQIVFHPGSILLKYNVDRGPGLTVVSARYAKYVKPLYFHPNEVITMQVVVGRNVTHVTFQSSQGYPIA